MKIIIRRYERIRKSTYDDFANPQEKIISGKNAREIMKEFNKLKEVSDLFSYSGWQIIDIKD